MYNAAITIYKNAQSSMWAGVNEPAVEIAAPTAANSWKLSADGQWYEMTTQIKTNKWIGTNPDKSGDVQLSWDTSTGALPAGTVVMNGSDDITAAMKPLDANHKQEGKWRVQIITIRVPAQVVDDYFNDPANKNATVFPMPALKALATDMAASNFYVASYVNGGGQPYLIEGNRKIDVTTAFQTAIPLTPINYDDPVYDMGLRVIKLESGTLISLSGATFRIAKIEDGAHYLDRITDMDGRIRIEDLDPGIYSIQEMSAPPGYVLNDFEFLVELVRLVLGQSA